MSATSPLPIDRPFGLSDDVASVQVSDSQTPLRGTNTSLPPSRSRRAAARVGRRQRSVVAAELSARDRLVLRRLEQHRYLSTMQLEAFVFTGHASPASAARTTRRVLARLSREGLIRPLNRRIGGVRAGSSATVWQLAPAGVRLLREEAGKGYRTHEPSERFLRHCLAVADAHLRLRALQAAPDVEQIEVQVEPDSWRRYSGSGGEARWLQPDLAAVITSGEFEDRLFIEVDCGTESLPTLLRKCEQYEAYRRSGLEQSQHGTFPLVLWLLDHPQPDRLAERIYRLTTSLQRSARFTQGLYRVTHGELTAASLGLSEAAAVGDQS